MGDNDYLAAPPMSSLRQFEYTVNHIEEKNLDNPGIYKMVTYQLAAAAGIDFSPFPPYLVVVEFYISDRVLL